jgi:hypothetical protein
MNFLNEKMEPKLGDGNISICYIKGKLYVRDPNQTEKPLLVFDPQTLQMDKEATESVKFPEDDNLTTMKFMIEPHKETGRFLA